MFLNEQGSADFMVDRRSKELASSVKKKHNESVKKYQCVNEKFANPISILLEKKYNSKSIHNNPYLYIWKEKEHLL